MKITGIDIIPFEIPYRQLDVTTSLGRHTSLKNVLVAIHSGDGITGWGETAPLPAFSGETQDSIVAMLSHTLAPWLLDRDPRNIHELLWDLDKLVWGQYFAKCSLDFALHDLLARWLEVPLFQILGGLVHSRLPLAWTIGWKSLQETEEQALKAVEQGYKALKIKIGQPDWRKDIARVEGVRRAVGDEIPIRVDANQGLKPHDAIRILSNLATCRLQMVEQPVSRQDIEGLRHVRRASHCPVMADESVTGPEDVMRLARAEAVDIINLKPQKFGGLVKSAKVAAVATAANLSLFPSSRMCSGIGAAAAAHFYAALPQIEFEGEFVDGVLMSENDLLAQPIEVTHGMVSIPTGHGIGVDIDTSQIKHYAKGRIEKRL